MATLHNSFPALLERLLALSRLPHAVPLALVLDLAAVPIPDAVLGAERSGHLLLVTLLESCPFRFNSNAGLQFKFGLNEFKLDTFYLNVVGFMAIILTNFSQLKTCRH